MPELPEIITRSREIQSLLVGRRFASARFPQPKCLNLPAEDQAARLVGQAVAGAEPRGKWIRIALDRDILAINLGMSGELLLLGEDADWPEKRQAEFTFEDGSRLAIHFGWIGQIHLLAPGEESEHPIGNLGCDPLAPDWSVDDLARSLAGRRVRIKRFLLDQHEIAGIGNMYAHDILFLASLHPDRTADSLLPADIAALHKAIRTMLQQGVDLGGARWEVGLDGAPGKFDREHFRVGYKEGEPCPRCGTEITKIRTGSTSSFICPSCQTL